MVPTSLCKVSIDSHSVPVLSVLSGAPVLSVRIAVNVLAPHRPGAVAIRSPRYVLPRSPFHPRSAYLAPGPGVPRSLVALSLCPSLPSRLIQANPSPSIHLHLLLWPSVAHTLSLHSLLHLSFSRLVFPVLHQPTHHHPFASSNLPYRTVLSASACTYLLYSNTPPSSSSPLLLFVSSTLPSFNHRRQRPLFLSLLVSLLSPASTSSLYHPFAPTSLSSTRPSTNPPILATPAPACPPASHTCKQSRNLLSRSAIELNSISISQPIDRDRIREASGTTTPYKLHQPRQFAVIEH